MQILDHSERVLPRVKFSRQYHAKKTSHAKERAPERWMISYVDVLTILLVFFIGMVAKQGQTVSAKDRAQAPPTALTKASTPVRDPLIDLAGKLRQVRVETRREARGLVISLPQAILFAAGDDQISAAARPTIHDVGAILKSVSNRISVVGHADPTPIHNQRFESNWALAAARGLELLNVLSSEYGIPDSRLSIASYGSTEPRSGNDTESGRAANRRVEIVVLGDEP